MPDRIQDAELADGAIEIDFTGVEENRLVPEGVYPARVQDAIVQNSKSSNQPTLYLTMEMIGPEKYIGRPMRYTVSLQKQAIWLVKSALIGLGYPKEDLEGLIRIVPSSLLDRVCGLRIAIQSYEGSNVNRVTKLLPIDKVPEEMLAGPEAPFVPSADGVSEESAF